MSEIIPGQLRKVKADNPHFRKEQQGEIFLVIDKQADYSTYTKVVVNGKLSDWSTAFIKMFSEVIG
jgi:hypothetical protein